MDNFISIWFGVFMAIWGLGLLERADCALGIKPACEKVESWNKREVAK